MLTVSRIALMIIITLLSITASATYFAATREQIPIYNPVSFVELDYASTSFGGVSMKPPENITSALKPLPLIFIVRREWHGATNVADYGVSFWTVLRSGEVIRFGFNATEPVDMDFVSEPSGVKDMHIKGVSSYNGTIMVASGGLYSFDFSVDDSLEKSVNAVVSFRCLGATNLETGELMISLETQSHLPVSHPPDTPIEYTYGLESDITSAAKLWVDPKWTPSLLQPTWLPEGMNQTAVYIQNSNVTTHTGKLTQVTTLYSYRGIRDPWTAEVQLRVQMAWDIGWLDPHPDMDMGIEGNYTTVNGNPAYVGLIGWFEGGYVGLYGGTTRIVSMRVGYVLYIFRAPENIPISNLIKMASSLKPVQLL